MAKHLAQEFNRSLKIQDRMADVITNFCGKMSFVYIHIVWFGAWVLLNIGLFAFVGKFDPFPFGLLTLIVSLEAIFLSTFVMISQNRTAQQADLRAQLDYETDVKAEEEIEQIIILLQEIHQALGLNKKEAQGSSATSPDSGLKSGEPMGHNRTTDPHAQIETLIEARRNLEKQMAEEAN